MAKLIFFSQYTKSKTHQANYADYISLKGVETGINNLGASARQKKLIEILTDSDHNLMQFEQFESYKEYKENPTKINATKFLTEALEFTDVDQIHPQAYVDYISNREGSRGLFNHQGNLDYKAEAAKLKQFDGAVYMHVFSVKKDDAVRLGYDNPEKWRETLVNKIPELAKQMKIPLHRLEWNAAFHQSATHPHVHVMMWDKENKAYQNVHSLEKMRSIMTNEIFSEQMNEIKQELALKKSTFYQQAQTKIEQTFMNGTSVALTQKINKLAESLELTKGKKVYGYLNASVKAKVNELVTYLLQDADIKKEMDAYLEQYGVAVDMYNIDPQKIISRVEEYRAELQNPTKKNTNKSLHNLVIKYALQRPEALLQEDAHFDFVDDITNDVTYNEMMQDLLKTTNVSYNELSEAEQADVQALLQETVARSDELKSVMGDGRRALYEELVESVSMFNEQQEEIQLPKQIRTITKMFETHHTVDIGAGVQTIKNRTDVCRQLSDNLRIVLKAAVIGDVDKATLHGLALETVEHVRMLDMNFSEREKEKIITLALRELTKDLELKNKYNNVLRLTKYEQKRFAQMTGAKQQRLEQKRPNRRECSKLMVGLGKSLLYLAMKNQQHNNGKSNNNNQQHNKNNLGRDWDIEL